MNLSQIMSESSIDEPASIPNTTLNTTDPPGSERPFECKTCQKKFTQKSHLKVRESSSNDRPIIEPIQKKSHLNVKFAKKDFHNLEI